MLNEKNKPLDAYEGDEQYIFVSYAPEDENIAFQEIKRFQDMGYNVWYNEDNKTENNLKYNDALNNCSVYVVLFTPNSAILDKINNEINLALIQEKHVLPIYLVETELDEMLEFALIDTNAISRYKLDIESYTSKCRESFKCFGLTVQNNSLKSKLVPGVGREPFPAYRGEEPYIFISYAHKDSNIVFPEIKRFQDMGYNVWYDEGIGAGNEWLKDVVKHLINSEIFLVFITNNSVASENVKKEIKYAVKKNKNMLPIYLEDFDEIEMEEQLDFELSVIQGILKTTLDEEEYIFKFTEAFKNFGFEPNTDDDKIFEKVELKSPEEALLDDALNNEVLYSDINSNTIKKYMDCFFDNLLLYEDYYNEHSYKELLKLSLDAFLEEKNMLSALDVYETFFSIYNIHSSKLEETEIDTENLILDLINIIKKFYENTSRHNLFTHSVNVFILGLAIYSQNNNYKEAFTSYVIRSDFEDYYKIEGIFSDEEFLLRWGITSLLHDIFYPFEKMGIKENHKIFKELDMILGQDRVIKDVTDLNEIVKKYPYDFTDRYSNRYPETKLIDLFKPTNIIAHKIAKDLNFDEKQFELLLNYVNNYLNQMNDTEFFEHGFFASLLVINSYDIQIQKYNMSPDFLFYPIADSAVAIFLHNYYKYLLQREPFNQRELNPNQSPLAYLLIMCDRLLEFYKESEAITDDKINEFSKIEIDDKKLDIYYTVESSSFGFGFSNDINFDDILLSIFDDGVNSSIDLSKVNNKHLLRLNNPYNHTGLMNLTEELAKSIHNRYLKEEYGASSIPDYTEFEKIPSSYKLLNIKEARTIFNHLNIIRCEVAEESDERIAIKDFSEEEILDLAELEHERWCEEKLGNGWTYGVKKDNEKQKHPCLVQWKDLDKDSQDIDKDLVKMIPSIVEAVGLKIVPSKLRLLTYQINNSTSEEFDKLKPYIQKLKYKKTDLIMETLSKLDYYIVDISHENNEIISFDDEETIYLAQECHDKWLKLNYNLGWKYDENYDVDNKTNPYLVIWEKLPKDYAKSEIKIFKELPHSCKETGLKIIKISYTN